MRPSIGSRGRVGGAVALLVGTLLLCATALADQFGPSDDHCHVNNSSGPCKADNSVHTYCWSGEFDTLAIRNASDSAMQNLADETQMSKQKDGCDGNTDIVWHTFGQPYYGLTLCIDTSGTSGGRQCQQSTIQLNSSALNATNNPGSARNVVSCHEVGHSGGLWHDTAGHTDCMDVQSDPSGQNAHYDEHHEDHLNTN